MKRNILILILIILLISTNLISFLNAQNNTNNDANPSNPNSGKTIGIVFAISAILVIFGIVIVIAVYMAFKLFSPKSRPERDEFNLELKKDLIPKRSFNNRNKTRELPESSNDGSFLGNRNKTRELPEKPDGSFLNNKTKIREFPDNPNDSFINSKIIYKNSSTTPLGKVANKVKESKYNLTSNFFPPDTLVKSDNTQDLFIQMSLVFAKNANPVDVDISCVAFDASGNLQEGVFKEQKEALGGLIKQTGTNNNGFDENIVIRLNKLPKNITILVISIHSYGPLTNFANLQSAKFDFLDCDSKQPVTKIPISQPGPITGYVVSVLRKNNLGRWDIFHSGKKAKLGRTYTDIFEVIIESLSVALDPILLQQRKNLPLKGFKLKKNNLVVVPKTNKTIQIGFGWTAYNSSDNLDFTASAAIFDKDGNSLEQVTNKSKNNSNTSVIHSGANTSEIDNQVITILLSYLPKNYHYIYFVLSSSDPNFTALIKNTYVRLFNDQGEITRFTVNSFHGNANCLVMGNVFKSQEDDSWKFKAIGVPGNSKEWTEILQSLSRFTKGLELNYLFTSHKGHEKKFILKVHSGRNLPALDANGKSDPFCEITFGQKSKRTKVTPKTLNPVWEESFDLTPEGKEKEIKITIYDKDVIGQEKMGEVIIDIEEMEGFIRNFELDTIEKYYQTGIYLNSTALIDNKFFPISKKNKGEISLSLDIVFDNQQQQ